MRWREYTSDASQYHGTMQGSRRTMNKGDGDGESRWLSCSPACCFRPICPWLLPTNTIGTSIRVACGGGGGIRVLHADVCERNMVWVCAYGRKARTRSPLLAALASPLHPRYCSAGPPEPKAVLSEWRVGHRAGGGGRMESQEGHPLLRWTRRGIVGLELLHQ